MPGCAEREEKPPAKKERMMILFRQLVLCRFSVLNFQDIKVICQTHTDLVKRIVLNAVLVLRKGFKALDVSGNLSAQDHRCIAVFLPSDIAAPGGLQRDVLMFNQRLKAIHDRIVLPSVIRLPA